jgi:hypothetical protein
MGDSSLVSDDDHIMLNPSIAADGLTVSYSLSVCLAGCWWLTPIILATQEAEIRRTAVQSHSGQIVHKTLSQKTLHKKGLME